MLKQLVIQLARFGDIVQTKRLILSLQGRGEVQLCVDRGLESLARLVYPGVEVIGLPSHDSTGLEILGAGRAVLDRVRAEHFDAVYILNHAGLARALASLFDPGIVRGYPVADGQPLRSIWMRLAFRWMERRSEAPLNLVDFWAALAPDMIAPHAVNPSARPGGGGLGVVMAGQNARRSLPPELLAPVVRAAFARLGGAAVYLFGSSAEQGAARRLLAALPPAVASRVHNLAGRTDWEGLARALAGLDLVLTPDTGTAHLAAHLGVPVEGLFCSSAWAFETGPYGAGHRVWQSLNPCTPCLESAPCPLDARCRDAFAQPPFLARMQGRRGGAASRPMPGIMLLESGFDTLGQVWRPPAGETPDPHAAARAAARARLAEYLGLGRAPAAADTLYREADWMLPHALP